MSGRAVFARRPAPWRSRSAGRAWPDRSASTAIWLFFVAAVVVAMVVVGGATRVTGSGLSITRWDPIVGALPPLSRGDWLKDFALYKATTQYQMANRGMGLADFQTLFWWEWAHRLLGRLIGIVFLAPLVALLAFRRIPRRLIGRCVGLLFLGALQGLVGWWMVRGGLQGRIAVPPERLAAHLGMALILLGGLVWTGLEAWAGRRAGAPRPLDRWTWAAGLAAGLIFIQCLAGALVAGAKAGLIENDWPLMGGRLAPTDYWAGSAWATLVRGPASVQFHHRLLAYALVCLTIVVAAVALRRRFSDRRLRLGWSALALLACAQAGLGIMTLVSGVPLTLALAHQLNAIVLFCAAVGLVWMSRRSQRYNVTNASKPLKTVA
ncbi:MAG: COX15/CtaA family protein [Caulobacteraceae bacterium]